MKSALAEALHDVKAARRKRNELEARLKAQDLYFGHVVREARDAGATWQAIGEAASISGVAALQAARRPPAAD